jgi:isopenicillin-N epimerase
MNCENWKDQSSPRPSLRIDHDADWSIWAQHWNVRADSIYLNHGSFGLTPRPVQNCRDEWRRRMDEQPMDFFVRQLEPALDRARRQLAEFVGTRFENLVMVENATFGMNVVAQSFPLAAGDEVLLNDHEYGAVQQIWQRETARQGATARSFQLKLPIESREEVVEQFVAQCSERTRLVIVSQITSPTALILPVAEICAALRSRGIAVCIDGPHAPAQIDVTIDQYDCDFYTASCHKWLCAPLGTGFLTVAPRWHGVMKPILQSWGRLLPAVPERWYEHFTWSGTRDNSGYLAIPTAIEFMQNVGLENFRQRTGWLAAYAESHLVELTGQTPLARRSDGFYGTMCHVPLPKGDWSSLQNQLWQQYRIEVPIVHFDHRWFVRVSCHLYTATWQIERLLHALTRLGIRPSVIG